MFTVKKLTIEPEVSPIQDEVVLSIKFTLAEPRTEVKWTVTYILDLTGKRQEIRLYETSETFTYQSDQELSFDLKTPKLEELVKVQRQTLLNVGLLRIEAIDSSNEVLTTINMVVHVSRDKQDESQLMKTILNPFD